MNERAPEQACHLVASEFSVDAANGESATTAPFRMVARSGRPIDHGFWGRVVHDNNGFKIGERGRIPIDYAHTSDVIGFANHFSVDEAGDLIVSGTLTPGRMKEDRALDVIDKARMGVPWEASINFAGTGIKVQKVANGESTHVNGFEFEGPGVVIREWPLRGVAVVPYGADQYTSTTFSQGDDDVAITYLEGDMATTYEDKMNELADTGKGKKLEQETAEVETPEVVEAEADTDTAESAEAPEDPPEAPADVEAELSSRQATGARYRELFGEAGPGYFCDGLTLDEAMEAHIKFQAEENAKLNTQLIAAQAAGGGEAEALSAGGPPAKKKERALEDPYFA